MAYLDDLQKNARTPYSMQATAPVSQGYLARQAGLQAGLNQQQPIGQQQAPMPDQQQSSPQQGSPGYMQGINPTPTGTTIAGAPVTAGMGSIQAPAEPQPGIQPSGPTGANPNPVAYGPNDLAKQEYATSPNNPLNQNGIFQGGFARGQIAAHEMQMTGDANNRANETQTWNRQEITKQQQISAGMQQAAKIGGYEGVVQFLQTADPDRAIKIQSAKTSLDSQMLGNQHLAMLNDTQKQAALVSGYGIIGKMGATLLTAPPEERNNMYQRMLPMIQAVVPDAPKELNDDASNMLMLAQAQANPQSILLSTQRQANMANSDVAKLNQDISNAQARGETPDTSPALAALLAKQSQITSDALVKQAAVHELETRAQVNQAALSKDKTQQIAAQQGINSKFQSNYDTQSKQWTDFDKNYQTFQGAVQSAQNGGGAAAKTAMGVAAAMLIGPKRMNPAVLSGLEHTDNGATRFITELRSRVNPDGEINMEPSEIGRLNNLVSEVHKNFASQQDDVNANYLSQANRLQPAQGDAPGLAGSISWHNTIPRQSDSAQDIDQRAQQAIAAGADPKLVFSRASQMKAAIGAQ